MPASFTIKRTTTADPHFTLMIRYLDHELWHELKEDQATYDQFNNVEHIDTAVVVYSGDTPVASGCFKEFDPQTIEIKRMFVQKPYKGRGISRQVLQELETWASEKSYRFAILETSIHFLAARNLYTSAGYQIIPNYAQYENLEESICMRKALAHSRARQV